MRNPDFGHAHRKKAAHHRERNRALWAGAAVVLICAGSLYMATNVVKPSDHLRDATRAGQNSMASKQVSGSGAGDQSGDDYLATGSILFVPHAGKYLPQAADRQQDLAHARQGLCDLRRSRVVEREYRSDSPTPRRRAWTRSAAASSGNSSAVTFLAFRRHPPDPSPRYRPDGRRLLAEARPAFIRPCDMAGPASRTPRPPTDRCECAATIMHSAGARSNASQAAR